MKTVPQSSCQYYYIFFKEILIMKIICLPFLFQLDFSNLCRSARTHTAPFCLRGNSGLKKNCNREFVINLHEASYKKPKIYIDKVSVDDFKYYY